MKKKRIDRKTQYLVKTELQEAIERVKMAESHLNFADEDHFDIAWVALQNARSDLDLAIYKMKLAYGAQIHGDVTEMMNLIKRHEPIGQTEFIKEFKKYLRGKEKVDDIEMRVE